MIVVIILSIAIVTLQKGQVTGYEYKRPVEASSFKIAEDVWLNQLHILTKRDGAHAHEHADSGYGAPPATYEKPAASYGAPAPTYKEPASRYDTARGFGKGSAETSSFKIAEDVWLNQLHIRNKRDGAHAHEHTDSGYGAPPATYEEPAASYGAPAPTYEEPASGY